jgi:cytochrome bd-type quinol oxidase subunit 2
MDEEQRFIAAYERASAVGKIIACVLVIGADTLNRLRGWFMSRPQARALLIATVLIVATAIWVYADKFAPRANIVFGALICLAVFLIIAILYFPRGGSSQ